MTAFTVTVAQNIDALASKAGGDTYAINGGILTIDQDTRYGTNQTTSASMGAITISSTLGGIVNIDGRYVRLIPFTGGSGVVPASNTTISIGGASGKLIGVWSSLTTAPTAAAAAMPSTGWIKIKAWNEIPFTAGSLTGISATGDVDITGWLDIIGDDAGTISIPRLGEWNVKGAWYQLGSTTGANTGTYQLPTSGLTKYCPGVFVESSPGSDSYQFYANAGTSPATAASFSSDWRSKVCWVSTDGIVRFGHDGTNSAGGYVPASGCNIRVGNVFLMSCTTAARTVNSQPHATLATRYETLTTSAGKIVIDKASVGWYLNCSQAYSVALTDTAVFDNITVSECATALTWTRVGVGQSAALANLALTMSLNFAGGSMTDITLTVSGLLASSSYISSIADSSGFTFTRLNTINMTPARGNATTGALALTRVSNFTFNDSNIGGGRLYIVTSKFITITNTTYSDNVANNTTTGFPMYMVDIAAGCDNIKIDGVNFGGLYMTQPYNGILQIGAAGCTNIKLRNIGTYDSPLSMGSPRRDDQAWTRVTTVATVTTDLPHGFKTGDTIYSVVSSDIAAITVGAKTITGTPTANSFTFTCLNAGTTSGTICYFGTKCGSVFVLATGSAANAVKVQRIFAPHTRVNLYTGDNSAKNITLENVFSDYLNIPIMAMLNGFNKNVSGTPTLAVQTAVYGTHWWNGYTCDVADNTVDCAWTRSGTTVTVTSVGHSLRTTAASTATVAQNIPISIIASSSEAAVPRGVQNFVTVVNSSTFKITGINAGATSGTLSYRVGNGRIGIVMNEPTVDTASQVSFDAGNPSFTSAGTLIMPTIGDQVTFTSPDYMLGQGSSFPIMELQIGGSTLTRYDFSYALDKNDENGFGAFWNLYYERAGGSGTIGNYTFNVTDATGVAVGDYAWGTNIANKAQVTDITGNTITVDSPNIGTVSGIIRFNHLPSESGLGPETGIKMKWRITTKTANTVGINFLYIFCESTNAGRAYQYPLDINTLTFAGLPAGCDVVVLTSGTSSILDQADSIPGTSYDYVFSGAQTVDVGFIKPGYVPYYIRGLALSADDSTIPVSLISDRNYI